MQPRNPLHGIVLERILAELVGTTAERIPVRCFTQDPSIASSLKFLRKAPWVRANVKGLDLLMLREQRRGGC